VGSTASRFPDPVHGELPADQAAALQRLVDTVVSDHSLTHAAGARGITAAVVSDRGSWVGAAGTDRRARPLEARSTAPIGGIADTFVAAEVMLLSSSGKVDLDAPLSDQVRHPLTADGATVRQFLGLRSRSDDPVPDDTSFRLLGRLVEEVTGESLVQAVRSDLVVPAGLGRATVRDVGIRADAATVAEWGYQLYGARLVDAGSVHAMTTPASVTGVAPGIGYGLGTEVLEGLSTDAVVGHLGDGPDHTSILVVVPARRLAVAVLMVGGGRNITAVARDLLAALG
jgi:D-alanyl-D-alanine carboxypeptidase